MKKLTSNKEASEMSLYELAHNSCYAKEGNARVRDFENDFDARELAVRLLGKYADIPNEFTCDEDFDDFMLDSLQYGMDSIQGLIAVFYRNIWAMADLRERLKEYEDIGLTPKQLMEVDKLYAEKCKELAELQERSFSGLELVKIWAKLKKFKEYQELEEQGKLLKLPCAVGDWVYKIKDGWVNYHKVDRIEVVGNKANNVYFKSGFEPGKIPFCTLDDFDKIVFLTEEEAKDKLKELRTQDRP